MKPNDKALDEALDEALSVTQIPEENTREYMRRILTAAYAAQFKSEDYAGLIDGLREWAGQYEGITLTGEKIIGQAADAIEAVLAERDTLKAELAKAQEIARMQAERIGGYIKTIEDRDAERDALAAIRPHIEAAERERANKDYESLVQERANQAACAFAAAIRSGK